MGLEDGCGADLEYCSKVEVLRARVEREERD